MVGWPGSTRKLLHKSNSLHAKTSQKNFSKKLLKKTSQKNFSKKLLKKTSQKFSLV